MEIIDIFHSYLRMAVARKASDAYFIAGQPPVVKVESVLENIAHEDIDKEHLAEFVFSIIPTQDARERVAQGKELDIIYAFEGSRFRTNIHLQQGMFALSIRVVSSEIPTPQFLNFHPTVYKFAQLKKGLVLLTGSTASGKSSVIASIVNMINHERRAHVITIEDPIEFVYPRKLAVIEQRQIGLDSNSFSDALKAAFRQDPDIIMVGEMRDLETIATALTAAETGHLVFGTVHSASTVEAIERIVNIFPANQIQQILNQLSGILVAAVSRELLARKGGGARVAAWEIMVNTPAISSLIRENRLASITSSIQIGSKDGMITLEQSKVDLKEKGLIL
ncbi:PilT/PilU family type 4a pilus ATPase [Candidatus Azambacteria bacterium]|nr:PilT/PilU family type 4a pilus ATPase [Candidatus Azambacteria bacterium]